LALIVTIGPCATNRPKNRSSGNLTSLLLNNNH
jgi:hypothetical protein